MSSYTGIRLKECPSGKYVKTDSAASLGSAGCEFHRLPTGTGGGNEYS